MFFGWYIVGASFLITLYVSGSINLGFTAIFEPIANELGWSYTQISFAASLRGLETGLLAPFAGMFLDRWGPRRLVALGALLNGFGLLLLSRVNTLAMFYTAFIFIAAGVSTATAALMMTVVANWFHKKAGLAMGVAASGVAFGGLLIPLITLLVDNFGWRQATVILGLGMWAILLPLSLLMRHNPEQYGYRPDGVKGSFCKDDDAITENRAKINITNKAVLSSRAFWIIAAAFLCHVMPVSAVMTHIMPYLSTIGIERSMASLIASALPILTILGRIGFGWLGDYIDKRAVLVFSFAFTSIGVFIFGFVTVDRWWVVMAFIIVFGIGWGGAVPMITGLMKAYFGRERLGTIVGMAGSIMMVGMIVGAPLAGWIFDTWGRYQPAWFLLAGVVGLSAVVFYASLKNTSIHEVTASK